MASRDDSTSSTAPARSASPSAKASDADRLIAAARALRAQGRPHEALAAADQAASLAPRRPDIWFVLAAARLDVHAFEAAAEAFAQAAALTPPGSSAQRRLTLERLRALALGGAWADAVALADAIIVAGDLNGAAHDALSAVFAQAMLFERALTHAEAAVEALPNDANAHYNHGTCARFLGRNSEARAAFERAVALDPAHDRAHAALSAVVKARADDNRVDRLVAAQARARPDSVNAARLAYAQFKELDDLGRRAEAWAALERGALIMRRLARYDAAAMRAQVDALKAHFSTIAAGVPRAGGARPIFVVGLPRSGTTLIERILGAHRDVFAMGEMPHFGLAVKRAARTPSRALFDVETIAAAARADWDAVAAFYWRETRYLAGDARIATDKLPQNADYCGLMALAFPQCGIVEVRRAPMDGLFGAYRLQFGDLYRWSYAFDDLAAHYALHEEMMAHWRAVLGTRMVTVTLEDVIDDPEREVRRLLAALDLPFDAACLAPHASAQGVSTASAAQVRQPINRQGVGAWRAYAAQLEPLRAALERDGFVDAGGDPLKGSEG
jgi:tetratricopeptide (TPR) repeat protein